jgi:hypothetical protein
MADVLRSQSVAAGVFKQCGQQYGNRHCYAAAPCIVSFFLGIYFKSPASACHEACHSIVHCLLLYHFPDNAEGLIPANSIKL